MNDIEITIRLLIALALGGLIGLEREIHGSDAGLRTHILVCLGSSLVMVVSILMAKQFPGTDPGRISAQVVSGIGFLGAGSILRSATSVRGLTTAASIWAVAGIGLGAGAGFYSSAAIASLLIVLTLWLLRFIEKMLNLKERERQ
ncbi:MAG: MgtC/SapB family protein [Candidatus Omnitrophica bacterium]|nr:MgtC/SapB family protein [Candidatus Omnitrophota bacterium]